MAIWTVPGISCKYTCKINEMIKCVSMLIFRIIRDFLILFCFILYFIYNVVNIVAL